MCSETLPINITASHPTPLASEGQGAGAGIDEGDDMEQYDRPRATTWEPLSEQPMDQPNGTQSRWGTDDSDIPSPLPTDPQPVNASETQKDRTRNQIHDYLGGAGTSHVDPQSTTGDRNASGGGTGNKGSRESIP